MDGRILAGFGRRMKGTRNVLQTGALVVGKHVPGVRPETGSAKSICLIGVWYFVAAWAALPDGKVRPEIAYLTEVSQCEALP